MPKDRTGLLIIRAWTEDGSVAPLRAQLSKTADISTGIEHRSVHSDVIEVGSEVETWLREILAGRLRSTASRPDVVE
jgi:hypothetical protein